MNFISNIDTICILVNIENYELNNNKLFEYLKNEKEKAKLIIKDNSTYKHIITLNDMNFQLLINGCQGYAFIIRNNAYEIKISQYKSKIEAFYPLQIRISSETLWSIGIIKAWHIIYNWIVETFGNIIDDKVCRLDLACHISDIDFITDYNNIYKGNFKKVEIFYTGKEINCLCFGSRKSNNIYVRIYNKTLEIQETKKKYWFYDVWKQNNMNINKVWNLEFEIKSDFFRKFSLSSVQDIINSLDSIWKYCTSQWLIKIDRTNKRVERCNISGDWLVIQKAYINFKSRELIEKQKQIELDSLVLVPNIVGNITSYSARNGTTNIEVAFSNLYKDTLKYLSNKDSSFEQEVHNKQKILGNVR